MKRIAIGSLSIVLIGILIALCLSLISHTKEPTIFIKVEGVNTSIPAYQGTYSWSSFGKGVCADYPAPYDMMKDKIIPVISPESILVIKFDYKPKRDTLFMNQWVDKKPVKQQLFKSNKIKAPKKKGVYIYDAVASWKEGTRSYSFTVEVR
jgi:hypothetical protein